MLDHFYSLTIEAKKIIMFLSFLLVIMYFVLIGLFNAADKADIEKKKRKKEEEESMEGYSG